MKRPLALIYFLPYFLTAAAKAQGAPDISIYYADFAKPEITKNEAFILQTGNANISYLDQQTDIGGSGNFALVEQSGSGNTVTLYQSGSANRFRIEQSGSDNVSSVTQSGTANSLDLTQSGIGNRLSMNQVGGSNIIVSQLGDFNSVDAPLIQPGITGTLTETGNNNAIAISPDYIGPHLSVSVDGGLAVQVHN